MDWKLALAFGGWVLAIGQFFFTYRETKRKNEVELLEKTLGYFERGTQARSIAISLVDGIWLKKKKYIGVILPVLISQVNFLLSEADEYAQESRNLIRLLTLVEKCLPMAIDVGSETAEISEAIINGALSEKGVTVSNQTLKLWHAKFHNGDPRGFEAEVIDS